MRSKAKWYNGGEKNTKYFLSLEKRHFKQSTNHIKVNDNAFIDSDGDILCECTSFYKNLYESKVTVTNFLDTSAFCDGENDTALKDYEINACEGKLNEKEALDALKTREPEKTPGTDGLPAEFYKVFWRDISSTLIDAIKLRLRNRTTFNHPEKGSY